MARNPFINIPHRGRQQNSALRSENDDGLEMDQLLEILDRKRKDLDRHIEQFRAVKEQEFRAFDYWLRHRARKSDIDHHGEVEPGRLSSTVHHQSPGTLPNGGFKPLPVSKTGLEGLEPLWPPSPPATLTEPGSKMDPKLTRGFYGIEGYNSLVGKKDNIRAQEGRQRELEFQGVFTPTYLPLLNGSEAAGASKDKDRVVDPGAVTPSQDSSSTAINETIGKGISAVYSSSAERSRPQPLTTQALSSSCPDSGDNGRRHRRTSSAGAKSDTSITSLRSSFKDPKTPRSPKRVMFDIDDIIVSPSTSPLMKKSKSVGASAVNDEVGSTGRGRKAGGLNEDGENFEIVKKKKPGGKKAGGKSKADKEKAKDSPSLLRTGLAAAAAERPDDQPDRKVVPTTTAFAVSATMSAISPALPTPAFVDDFEKVSLTDDMFTFDEDLDVDEEGPEDTSEAALKKEALAAGAEVTDGDFDSEGGGANPVLSMTGSSPHAGSLPIEIRWPGRKQEA